MTKVLIPINIIIDECVYEVSLILNAFSGTAIRSISFKGKWYLSVDVPLNKGKKDFIQVAKNLNASYCFFIKNNILYQKWLDTGIVDKLGNCEIININEMRLKE